VTNLNSSMFEVDSGKTIQWKTRKLPVSGEAPLSVMTRVQVKKNMSGDPIYIILVGFFFTHAS
jgi:hypothetical protein